MSWMLAIAFALMVAGTLHAAASPEELAVAAINALPPHDKWDRVELRSVANSLEVIIYYREEPDDTEEVEDDTKSVAAAILQALAPEDQGPETRPVGVYVHGFRRTTRASGKPLLIDYGFSFFDYADGRLIFRPSPYSH